MKTFTDQTGKTIQISKIPKSIVSLVPSQSELLADLGLDETVKGITKFCVHPERWFQTKTKVGGTKKLNLDVIRSLQPDLIIANKEENEKSQVEELASQFPVWTSDISTLAKAKEMIWNVGEITGTVTQALKILQEIDSAFDEQNLFLKNVVPIKAAYLIWKEPYMIAGGDTFISSMMQCAGLTNVFEDLKRYPEVTMEMISARSPEVIILSSEPYPFKEKHLKELQDVFIHSKALLADGELFSWYGSRLKHAPVYFRSLFEQIQSYR